MFGGATEDVIADGQGVGRDIRDRNHSSVCRRRISNWDDLIPSLDGLVLTHAINRPKHAIEREQST